MVLVLLALAVYRVTRLLAVDAFPPIAAARLAVQHRFGPEAALSYLVECPWCVSVYVSAVLTLLAALTVGLPAPWLVWPAMSAVTGLITANLDPE